MHITRIGSAGYLFEAMNCSILIDYQKGRIPPLREDKPLYVLGTSRERYAGKVARLAGQYPTIYYYLSSDIQGGDRVPEAIRPLVTWLHPDEKLKLARFRLDTIGAASHGLAFGLGVSTFRVLFLGAMAEAGEADEKSKVESRKLKSSLSALDSHYDLAFLPSDEATLRKVMDHTSFDQVWQLGDGDPAILAKVTGKEVKEGRRWDV